VGWRAIKHRLIVSIFERGSCDIIEFYASKVQ